MSGRILIVGFLMLILGVVTFSYTRYLVAGDFIVYDHVPCDPSADSCFREDCYLESSVGCEEGYRFFKVVYKKVGNIAECSPWIDGECGPLSCEPGEESCETITCSDENVSEYQLGEVCEYAPNAYGNQY